MSHNTPSLKGYAILVVEDEPLIALDITTTLEDAGATVIGPCASIDHALSLIDTIGPMSPMDGAVLDVNLGKQTSIPIARFLQARGVPFVFHTGMHFENLALLEDFEVPVIHKPSTCTTLTTGIAEQLGNRGVF
jgi:DNA-binding response OmpR family regulator